MSEYIGMIISDTARDLLPVIHGPHLYNVPSLKVLLQCRLLMPTCSSGAESTQLSEYFTPGLSYWPDDRREAFTALRWHRCHLKPCSPGGENRCLAVHGTNVHAQKVKEEVIITKRHHIHTLMSGALTIHGANMLIRSNFRFSIRVS